MADRFLGGQATQSVRQALIARRSAGEAALRERFTRAVAEGDLASDVDPADLARYFTSVMHGMAVQAASGAGREALLRVVEIALRAWPEASPKSRKKT